MIGHSDAPDELDALELTWLLLLASWPLACLRLDIDLSVKLTSC